MSTLFNPNNAPRDLTTLSQMSNAVLYRLGMQLNLFKDDENAERAFMACSSAEKAPIILARLHEIDNNPQAAAAMAMPMTLPPQQEQEHMSQQNFPGAPPGAQPFQQQLPYGAPPAPPGAQPPQWQGPPQGIPGFAPPPGYGPPPGAPPGPPPPQQQQQYYQPPQAPQGPPQGPPQGAPQQQGWTPPGPPGAPQGYGAPPAPPPGPPQGQWQPPGPPQGPPQGPPMGAPHGAPPPMPSGAGWAPPGPPQGPPPGMPQGGPPPGFGPPPVAAPQQRQPQTASDPSNQGSAAGQLLEAIQALTTQLSRQNDLLAGLSTLTENGFIANVIIAERMGITQPELSHRLGAERETIKAQFTKSGKA